MLDRHVQALSVGLPPKLLEPVLQLPVDNNGVFHGDNYCPNRHGENYQKVQVKDLQDSSSCPACISVTPMESYLTDIYQLGSALEDYSRWQNHPELKWKNLGLAEGTLEVFAVMRNSLYSDEYLDLIVAALDDLSAAIRIKMADFYALPDDPKARFAGMLLADGDWRESVESVVPINTGLPRRLAWPVSEYGINGGTYEAMFSLDTYVQELEKEPNMHECLNKADGKKILKQWKARVEAKWHTRDLTPHLVLLRKDSYANPISLRPTSRFIPMIAGQNVVEKLDEYRAHGFLVCDLYTVRAMIEFASDVTVVDIGPVEEPPSAATLDTLLALVKTNSGVVREHNLLEIAEALRA